MEAFPKDNGIIHTKLRLRMTDGKQYTSQKGYDKNLSKDLYKLMQGMGLMKTWEKMQ